jgi:hypothetical protein
MDLIADTKGRAVMRHLRLLVLIALLLSCAPFPDIPESIHDVSVDPEKLADESPASTTDSETANETEADPLSTGDHAVPEEKDPVPDFLVINELYYDAPGSDIDGVLFVELFGSPGGALEGYQLRFINGDNGAVTELIEFPANAYVNDAGFFVIADSETGSSQTTRVAQFDFIDNFDPQNGPDGVQLFDGSGNLLDSLVYGEGAIEFSDDGAALGEGLAAPDVESGQSLARAMTGEDSNNNANDFIINSNPSPGEDHVQAPLE